MKMSVSPAAARSSPLARARFQRAHAWSCRRRRCGRRAARVARWPARVASRHARSTRCACGARRCSRLRTGWKVPAPTCSVTLARAHAARVQCGQQRLVEVQRGGRRGHRAGVPGEHGLVAAARRRCRRRARCTAAAARGRGASSSACGSARKAQVEQRAVGPGQRPSSVGVEAAGEAQHVLPGLRRLAGAHVRQHLVLRQHALDQQLAAAPPLGFSPNSRALMTCVSLNTSRSPGCSSAGRSRKTRSTGSAAAAIEQARGAAFGGRVLGDQLGGQVEIEIGEGREACAGCEGCDRSIVAVDGAGRPLVPRGSAHHGIAAMPRPGRRIRHGCRPRQPHPRPPRRCPARPRRWPSSACARYRPGAAPAAALRGRNPHRTRGATRATATWRRSRAWSPTATSRCRPRRQLLVTVRRRQRHLRAALLQLLSVAAEGAGAWARGCACAARLRGGFLGRADGASDVQGGRRGRAAADRADAGLSDRRPACRRPTCARRSLRRWRARRWTRRCPPAACPARLPGACARRCCCLHQPAPRRRWPRWKTAATRPGSG